MKNRKIISEKFEIKLVFTLAFYIAFASIVNSQTVSTLVTGSGLNGPDGFALDTAENLYVANWGNGSGNNVLKITKDASVSTYATGFSAPDGLAFDTPGNLYVSNYGSDIINKVTPEGTISEFATGFNNPGDLAFDSEWNLYVSNHGNANGTTVSKITPDGTVSTFATGFNGPVGLVFDDDGNLYVSNYSSGIINQVSPEGEVGVYASIPNSPISRIQYLIFDDEGNLYVPSYTHNKIYIISPEGEVSVFAGTGVAGSTNGSVDSAQFNGPNSIAITDSGIIYVSEYNTNRIRKITPDSPVAIFDNLKKVSEDFKLYQNHPNPFSKTTKINYELKSAGRVKLCIYDNTGKEIGIIVNQNKSPGKYSIEFDGKTYLPGIYYYKLNVDNEMIDCKKLVIIE